MTHEESAELLPAYVLDALSPEEARSVEAHLQTCEICRRDLGSFRQTTAQMAVATISAAPPAQVRDQIMSAIRPPAQVLSLPRSWAVGVAAAAAAVVIVAALTVASFSRQVALLQQRIAAQEQVLAILAGPTAKSSVLSGSVEASVRFVYDPARGEGALVVSNLRDPGQQFIYQLWLIAGAVPESAGVFRPQAGRPIILPVRADFTRYQAVAISIERAPLGAARPTTTPILLARI